MGAAITVCPCSPRKDVATRNKSLMKAAVSASELRHKDNNNTSPSQGSHHVVK